MEIADMDTSLAAQHQFKMFEEKMFTALCGKCQ